jgi:hypothetical protein
LRPEFAMALPTDVQVPNLDPIDPDFAAILEDSDPDDEPDGKRRRFHENSEDVPEPPTVPVHAEGLSDPLTICMILASRAATLMMVLGPNPRELRLCNGAL